MKLVKTLASIALALFAATVAAGAPARTGAPVAIPDVQKYLGHQQDLRSDMRTKKFKHVAEMDKRRLFEAQDRIFELLEGKRSIDELDDEELIALYNAQEEVNAVITDAELDRPICKRETVVGSHRGKTVCLTVRERQDLELAGRQVRTRNRTCKATLGGYASGGSQCGIYD